MLIQMMILPFTFLGVLVIKCIYQIHGVHKQDQKAKEKLGLSVLGENIIIYTILLYLDHNYVPP